MLILRVKMIRVERLKTIISCHRTGIVIVLEPLRPFPTKNDNILATEKLDTP
jgi:hypothetical protein